MGSSTTNIYLVRHCQYKNPRKVIPFRLPGFPLSQAGKTCADSLGDYFKNKIITHIYHSPILRAKQTAHIIGKKLDIQSVASRNIIETKTPFQGAKKSWFDNKGGDTFMQAYHLKHGGETIKQVFQRSQKLINGILKNHPGKSTLIVTHGDAIMTLIYGIVDKDPEKYLLKKRLYIPMGGIFKLSFENDKLTAAKKLNY